MDIKKSRRMRYASLIFASVLILLVGVTASSYAESRLDCNAFPGYPGCKPTTTSSPPLQGPSPRHVSVPSPPPSDELPILGHMPSAPVLIPMPKTSVGSRQSLTTSVDRNQMSSAHPVGIPRISEMPHQKHQTSSAKPHPPEIKPDQPPKLATDPNSSAPVHYVPMREKVGTKEIVVMKPE